jgi:hypothetical protein
VKDQVSDLLQKNRKKSISLYFSLNICENAGHTYELHVKGKKMKAQYGYPLRLPASPKSINGISVEFDYPSLSLPAQ